MAEVWKKSWFKQENVFLLSALVITIFVLLSLSVNLGLFMEVSEHPEYFVAAHTSGTSMEPTLESGDILIVKLNTAPHLHMEYNDVIIYKEDGHYIGHRLLYFKNGYYYTSGDNTPQVEKVKPDMVVGKMMKTIDDPLNQYVYSRVITW